MKYAIILFTALSLTCCTDAEVAKRGSYGNKFTVEVLSGGTVLRTYTSTGKVLSGKSNGYYFTDAATGKLVEVSGNCIIIITQL